jgi:hypothetical protein
VSVYERERERSKVKGRGEVEGEGEGRDRRKERGAGGLKRDSWRMSVREGRKVSDKIEGERLM